eukprot:TRINITY_DN6558_c0_g1_i1.p1 TRINITY_DN6558_c0_g1~~TRINITY_DN6558_c0_g1_i1.p1  ORF type:complete len:116 (-),score=23.46 TRINITY_DN6558_c0_g1_i1:434-781(-)
MGISCQTITKAKNMKVVLALSCMAAVASAMPYPMAYPAVYYPEAVYPQEAIYRPVRQISRGDDLQTAADTGYAAPGPVGRVKIQVYRGPSKGDYDFAPWGYYNTQPADLGVASYH